MKKPKHYTSIDNLPQYNWRMISEKNDLSFMLVDRTKQGNKEELKQAFDIIRDEYIDTFGIGETHLRLIELDTEIMIRSIEVAMGDRFAENFLDMALLERNNLLSKTESNNHTETNTRLSKYMGFHVNERTTTVREYQEMVKTMISDLTTKKAA